MAYFFATRGDTHTKHATCIQLEFGMYPQSMPTEWTHARTLRPWQSVRELGTSVEQPSVVNQFFFRIAIFCRVRA